MDRRALDKIKKCLRLAKSDNANEAAAALRQAQKLMAKHGLNDVDVQLADVTRHRAKSGTASHPPRWMWLLMSLIKEAFGVEYVYHAERGPQTRWRMEGSADFIGVGEAPEVAAYAFSILHRQLKKDRSAFLQALPPGMRKGLKTRRADLFAEAWLSAVYQKVKDLTVSVKESQLVATWMEREYGEEGIEAARDRRHKGALLGDAEAIREGIEKGKQVQLHHGVAGSAAPEALPGRVAEAEALA